MVDNLIDCFRNSCGWIFSFCSCYINEFNIVKGKYNDGYCYD